MTGMISSTCTTDARSPRPSGWSRLLPALLALLVLSQPAVAGTSRPDKPAAWPVHVPDTGQNACYDNLHRIACPPPGAPFYGQDAEYLVNPPRCEKKTVAGATLLIDHVTGLTWQLQTAPKPLDWSAALDYTDALALGGFTDWRLPESRELRTIMRFGEPGGKEKKEACRFPLPAGEPCFWSFTTRKFPALDAQSVCLGAINQVRDTNKDLKRAVRAVRGKPLPGPSFRDNGDGTVTDLSTGLEWQQTEARPMTWQQALAYCERLELAGHRDWRLPSIRELQTLVDPRLQEPALDSKVFPGCRPEPYWSSTTRSDRPAFAWTMDFSTGLEYGGGYKTRLYSVRAVRGGDVQRRQPAVKSLPLPRPAAQPEKKIHPFPRPAGKEELLEPLPLEM